MSRDQTKPSHAAEPIGSDALDAFAALLSKEFHSSSAASSARIEAAMRTLAELDLAQHENAKSSVFVLMSNLVKSLRREIERRPEARDTLEGAVDELTALMSLTDETNGSAELLEEILADPSLLKALKDSSESLLGEKKDGHPFPQTAARCGQDVSSNRSFTPQVLTDLLEKEIDSRRLNIAKIVNLAIRNKPDNSGEFIENKFNRISGKQEIAEFSDEVLGGSLGLLSKFDREFVEKSFDKAQSAWQNALGLVLFLKDRLNKSSNSQHSPSVVERTEQLAAYAKEYGGEGLEEFARLLFPEWSFLGAVGRDVSRSEADLPTEAPELYQGLRGPETPPAFVQRVYGEWLGHGLTRAHIRKLDPKLYTAIDNWLKKPGCEWPSEVDLPTLREQNDRWAERVQNEGLGPVLGDTDSSFALKEAARLRGVLERRKEK